MDSQRFRSYNVSTHMDIDSRIKVLTRRITVHKSEIPSGRDSSSQATHLQLRQFIGQDLAALELCFENRKDFNDYTTKQFNWKYAMCHLYIVYYRFLNDYPMFVYSGLPWTTIRNECTKWPRWLDSDEAKLCPQMIIHQAHSGKGLCHIARPLTMMTTQLLRQTVFIQLKMMERGMAINPLKTT